ncbi:hypothetical protein NPIL_615481, partial [Nephila pilipes]
PLNCELIPHQGLSDITMTLKGIIERNYNLIAQFNLNSRLNNSTDASLRSGTQLRKVPVEHLLHSSLSIQLGYLTSWAFPQRQRKGPRFKAPDEGRGCKGT